MRKSLSSDGRGIMEWELISWWGNRDIRYNVLRAVGYYKGKPVAEDIIILEGLERAPRFDALYQEAKPVLKGEEDIITCIASIAVEMNIRIASGNSGHRIIWGIPVHGLQILKV